MGIFLLLCVSASHWWKNLNFSLHLGHFCSSLSLRVPAAELLGFRTHLCRARFVNFLPQFLHRFMSVCRIRRLLLEFFADWDFFFAVSHLCSSRDSCTKINSLHVLQRNAFASTYVFPSSSMLDLSLIRTSSFDSDFTELLIRISSSVTDFKPREVDGVFSETSMLSPVKLIVWLTYPCSR